MFLLFVSAELLASQEVKCLYAFLYTEGLFHLELNCILLVQFGDQAVIICV